MKKREKQEKTCKANHQVIRTDRKFTKCRNVEYFCSKSYEIGEKKKRRISGREKAFEADFDVALCLRRVHRGQSDATAHGR